MELSVSTDLVIRKFLHIHYMASPKEPSSNLFKFSDFLSPKFKLAVDTYELACSKSASHSVPDEIWLSLFDGKKPSNNPELSKLRNMLQEIDMSMLSEENTVVATAKADLLSDFKKFEPQIKEKIKNIFGFDLQEKLFVILDIANGFSQGMTLSRNLPMVALSYPAYSRKIISVLLHEMLHTLITDNLKVSLSLKDYNLEEALLDYFAPFGMLDDQIGLRSSKLDIEKHAIQQQNLRPKAASISKDILNIMKEYQNICGNITIWEFLENKGVISQL